MYENVSVAWPYLLFLVRADVRALLSVVSAPEWPALSERRTNFQGTDLNAEPVMVFAFRWGFLPLLEFGFCSVWDTLIQVFPASPAETACLSCSPAASAAKPGGEENKTYSGLVTIYSHCCAAEKTCYRFCERVNYIWLITFVHIICAVLDYLVPQKSIPLRLGTFNHLSHVVQLFLKTLTAFLCRLQLWIKLC